MWSKGIGERIRRTFIVKTLQMFLSSIIPAEGGLFVIFFDEQNGGRKNARRAMRLIQKELNVISHSDR